MMKYIICIGQYHSNNRNMDKVSLNVDHEWQMALKSNSIILKTKLLNKVIFGRQGI